MLPDSNPHKASFESSSKTTHPKSHTNSDNIALCIECFPVDVHIFVQLLFHDQPNSSME